MEQTTEQMMTYLLEAQLASLTSRIDPSREQMNVKMDTTAEKMDAWIAEMKDG
jgi:hypothetical protein